MNSRIKKTFFFFGRLFFAVILFLSSLTVYADPIDAPPGIIALWRGDNTSMDSVGGHHGVLTNGASYATGEVNQAFSVNGDGQYVEVPDNDQWAFGTNDFTIELWANFSDYPIDWEGGPSGGAFISSDEGGGDMSKWWFATSGGVVDFHINDPTNGPLFLVNASFSPDLNTWYHFAVTRNGNLFTIYVNGQAIGSDTSDRAVPNANIPLMIGQAEGYFFNGLLDEVSIYNRGLSADEIQSIYNAGSNGKRAFAAPSIWIGPDDVKTAIGHAATFTVAAVGTEPLAYQWWHDESPVIGATSSNLVVNNVQTSDAGSYFVVITNAFGFTFSSSVTLVARAIPTLSISRTNNNMVLVWPLWAHDFALQSETNALFFTNWFDINAPQQNNGNQIIVTVPATGTAQFFRLELP